MAYETGTASNYKDLLRRLRRFLLGYATVSAPVFTGTGNGTITGLDTYPAAVTENWTLTCTAAVLNGGTFSVTGSVSGAQAAATVGVAYDNAKVKFTINDGSTDFIVGDQFTFTTTAGVMPSAQRWIDKRLVDAGSDIEWIFMAPGLAGTEQIYGGIRSYESIGSDYYNWALIGCTGFVSGNVFALQPGASSEHHMMFWNQPILYWFVGNGRRVVMVAKVSTYYGSMYLGHLLPYATPQQYPYPLAVGAMSGVSGLRYSETTSENRSPFDPGADDSVPTNTSLVIYHIDGTWQKFNNWWQSTSTELFQGGHNAVWPHDWSWVRNCVDGSYAVFPLIPTLISSGIAALGEFDGVCSVSGFANASENTITIGGDTYLVFQNGHRTGGGEYFALKLA